MAERYFPIVSYAVQSRGPVLSGLITDNGPASVMPYLIDAGYHPVFFDFNNTETVRRISSQGKERFLQDTVDELDDFVKSTGSKVITFKVYANGMRDTFRIAEELKKRNKGLIAVGTGPQVGIFREKIFSATDAFDLLQTGDGRASAAPIAAFAYEGMDVCDVPNVMYKANGKVERTAARETCLDDLKFPIYSEEFYPAIGDKIFIPVIVDSKGCPYAKCTFCNHAGISGRYETREMEKLIAEIESNRKEYGARVSRLSGNPTPSYVNELARRLPSDHRLSMFGCVSDGYDFEKLQDKVIGLFCGLESADERVLTEVFHKTDDAKGYLSKARRMASEMKKTGIPTVFSMIVPAPFETDESMRRSLEFILDVDPSFVPALPIGVFPNTILTNMAMKEGAASGVLLDDDYVERWMSYELDLLMPPKDWPAQPYQVVVNGGITRDIFAMTQRFLQKIGDHGIRPLSDEIVLMAHLYHGGLDSEQEGHRKQCISFNDMCRKAIAEGDWRKIEGVKDRINANQTVRRSGLE